MKFALFENTLATDGYSNLFIEPIAEICIYAHAELVHALQQISIYSANGNYAIGYIAYDLAVAKVSQQPLLHFVIYKQLIKCSHTELLNVLQKHNIVVTSKNYNIPFIESEISFADYQAMFQQVTDNLIQGNSYQINLTKRLNLDLTGCDLFALYYQLSRQNPVAYAAYLPFSSQAVISISPELFFKKDDTQITVKPMKGTAPRHDDSETNEKAKSQLAADEKNRAENLIIVDLLRNDLAKFAKTGSVAADKLFAVEEYATVLQMTSQISAEIENTTSLQTIINGLFPCGSITGAPKKKTIELIEAIEQSPRGVYTGAIGYVLPSNDMLFNVAIRTITQCKDEQFAQIGVGGGITINSTAQDEWQEIKTKLRFISQFYQPDFNLVESLLIKNGRVENLEAHLARLINGADKLLFNCDVNSIKQQITTLFAEHKELNDDNLFKLRIELQHSGKYLIEYAPIQASTKIFNIMVLNKPLDTSHPLFNYKTTATSVRGLYTKLDSQYKPAHIDELIFINQHQQITEGRFYNFIIQINGQLITPPLTCGLLGGIFRQQLLDTGVLIEQIINVELLDHAEKIYLCNDVRGLIECHYCGEINP